MSESAEHKRILVVDDEEDVQILVSRILRDAGYTVDRASDGKEAIEQLDSVPPDLIVLDLMMPGRGGFDVLKDLQAADPDIPIFVVTARALDPSTFQMISMESNVKGVHQKPLDMKVFNAKLHDVLGTVPPQKFENWQG